MGAPAVVAMMRRREREVVEVFRVAGALSPSTAQSYTAVGFGESQALKRLRDRAVIREAEAGTYYLDEEVWAAVRRTRQRIAMILIPILILLMLGFALGVIK